MAVVVEVVAHELDDLLDCGRRGSHAGCQDAVDAAEDPRGAECAAADHDAGAFGEVDHADGVGGGADVAVADDGDFFYCGDNLCDAVESCFAGEAHGGGWA